MVLLAETDQHGWALEYIGCRYLVDKVVFVLECGASSWLPANSLDLPPKDIQKTYLPVGGRPSFVPLLSDYKLSPGLGKGYTVVKETDTVLALRKLSCWKFDVHALRMHGASCQSVFSLVSHTSTLLFLVFFRAQICAGAH